MTTERVALVHDYLTQRGGAERVVLSMVSAFPDASVHTSLYEPQGTFPQFGEVEVKTTPLNQLRVLRRHHRMALPLLAPAFSRVMVEADVVVCSSSGWAHGVRTNGRKIVYCHTPARWLYQRDRYLGPASRFVPVGALDAPLRRWDRRAANSAQRYLVNSRAVRQRVKDLYGWDAEVLAPPPAVWPGPESRPVDGLDGGFWLCIARLLPYKNVDRVVSAFADLPTQRLVIAGSGPDHERLRAAAGSNVHFAGVVGDAEMRWLYANCRAVLSASYEDFGLTPVEAGMFGKPSVVLEWGGFLDTVVCGLNGVFFPAPEPAAIANAVLAADEHPWSEGAIKAHAATFDESHFIRRLREIVDEELATAPR